MSEMEVVLSNCSSPKMLTRRVVGRLGVAVRAQQRTPGLHRFLASQVPSPNDAFANGTNAYYADEMYRLWKQDPPVRAPVMECLFFWYGQGVE